ncbi:MAG: zinc finger Ran-binding domain-containing protein, partial [Spirillospora sp.]
TDTFAPAGAPGQAAAPAAAEPEPENQPFERDGRWWFRRGEELLVYDEQTGQWMPAPQPVPGGQYYAGAGASAGPQTSAAPAEEAQSSAGGFWKCPSCGAVNGSTATSCRMCFAARP